MPSPFPGMDPYLEGYLWPDVHQRLATEISRQLTPRLRPRYVARLAVSMIQDRTPEAEIGIMYPDIEVVKSQTGLYPSPISGSTVAVTETTVVISEPLILPRLKFEVRTVTVEIRDTAQNQLITTIEILSPVNKREPGLTDYRHKRERLEQAGVHLLEIDLIRRGIGPLSYYPHLPDTNYLIILTRAQSDALTVWPAALPEPLPVVAVPLREPDPDVPLALNNALQAIYDEAAYDLSIDYNQPPPPPQLSGEELAWLKERIQQQHGS